MKRAVIICLLSLSVHGQSASRTCQLDADKIADAIYRAEGGTQARVPYGILTVKVGNTAQARHACLTTIRNNWQRWHQAGRPGDFIDFLGDHYCPPSVDPVGNANWKHNVKFFTR
jgi:hypothetical protein